MANHVELFHDLATLARRLNDEPHAALEPEIAALEARGERLLLDISALKPAYQRPAALREHWHLVGAIRPMLERMAPTRPPDRARRSIGTPG